MAAPNSRILMASLVTASASARKLAHRPRFSPNGCCRTGYSGTLSQALEREAQAQVINVGGQISSRPKRRSSPDVRPRTPDVGTPDERREEVTRISDAGAASPLRQTAEFRGSTRPRSLA